MAMSEKQIALKHLVAHRAKVAAELAGIDSVIASMGGNAVGGTTAVTKAPGKRVWTEQQKQEARNRLAAARAAKAAKAAEGTGGKGAALAAEA